MTHFTALNIKRVVEKNRCCFNLLDEQTFYPMNITLS